MLCSSISGEITGFGLSKFHQSNSFPYFLSKRLQMLIDLIFGIFQSTVMTYRSSLSFVTLYRFSAKWWALDLVNFSDQTVFSSFFLDACRYWADFWHVSQSSWLTDKVGVSLHLIDFLEITRLTLSKFHRWISFPDFFLYPCRYCAYFWHVSQSPAFLKAMHTKTDTFLSSSRMIKFLLLLLKGYFTSRNTCSR